MSDRHFYRNHSCERIFDVYWKIPVQCRVDAHKHTHTHKKHTDTHTHTQLRTLSNSLTYTNTRSNVDHKHKKGYGRLFLICSTYFLSDVVQFFFRVYQIKSFLERLKCVITSNSSRCYG